MSVIGKNPPPATSNPLGVNETITTAQAQKQAQVATKQGNTKAADYWDKMGNAAKNNGGTIATFVPTEMLPTKGEYN